MNNKSLKHNTFIVLFGTIAMMLTPLFYAIGQNQTKMVSYFTDNGYGAALATTMHPSGEYYDGITYVTYQGSYEDPYVAAYEHATKKWIGPFKAGTSVLGKDPNVKIDNHGRPAMIVDNDGYIHIVFGGHGGSEAHGKNPLGNTHGGEMIHVVTKKPLDITSWEVLPNIPPFGTYNQFVKMDNGTIFLFYRHGAHKSNWVYQKSTDNCRTFDAPVSILKTKLRSDKVSDDAWYGWFKKGPGDKIIAVYNYHHCKNEANHDGERHNGYYMEMDAKSMQWSNVQGDKLKTPLTKEYSDRKTLVVDTGDSWTIRETVSIDSKGFPHLSIRVGQDNGTHHGGAKQMKHFRWTGKKWTDGASANLPVSNGDMSVSSPENIAMFLSFKKENNGKVSRFNSIDGGKTFKEEKVLLELKKTNFNISSLIRNAHPDAKLMVGGKKGNTDFVKMYLLGENGPVKRIKTEAEQLSSAEKGQPKRPKDKR